MLGSLRADAERRGAPVTNVARIGSGKGRLRPCPPDWWIDAVTDAGFGDVRYEHVISEAGIVFARRSA